MTNDTFKWSTRRQHPPIPATPTDSYLRCNEIYCLVCQPYSFYSIIPLEIKDFHICVFRTAPNVKQQGRVRVQAGDKCVPPAKSRPKRRKNLLPNEQGGLSMGCRRVVRYQLQVSRPRNL